MLFRKAIRKNGRGQKVPYFIRFSLKMIDKKQIEGLVDEFLEGTDKFLCEVKIRQGNIISISIDSDTFVSIDDCIVLSKKIESKFDRDAEDFELRVSSFGADKPLKFSRQYTKNIGRQLEVKTKDGETITGNLKSFENDTLVIETPLKKKTNTEIIKNVALNTIDEARVVLKFK